MLSFSIFSTLIFLQGEKEEVLSKVETELAEDQQREEQKQQRLKEQIQEEKRQRFSQLNAWKVRKVATLKTKSDIQNIFDENILDKYVFAC